MDDSGTLTYALEGSVFVTGAAIQWLRDGLGLFARASDSEELARSVDDSAGVVFVPALTGLGAPDWDPDARGAILGLTRGVTRAHVVRATLEAIAFEVRDVVDAMAADAGFAADAAGVAADPAGFAADEARGRCCAECRVADDSGAALSRSAPRRWRGGNDLLMQIQAVRSSSRSSARSSPRLRRSARVPAGPRRVWGSRGASRDHSVSTGGSNLVPATRPTSAGAKPSAGRWAGPASTLKTSPASRASAPRAGVRQRAHAGTPPRAPPGASASVLGASPVSSTSLPVLSTDGRVGQARTRATARRASISRCRRPRSTPLPQRWTQSAA